MSTERKVIRRHYIFHGDVQGVGFRYHAKYAAGLRGLTGWVENCSDGTVEMEVQGTSLEIAEMLGNIRHGSFIHIGDIEVRDIPVDPFERSFHVRGY